MKHARYYPLSAHRLICDSGIQVVEQFVGGQLGGRIVGLPDSEQPIGVIAGRYQSKNMALWSCCYTAPVTLQFPEVDFYRLQLHLQGGGCTTTMNRQIDIGPDQGCITASQSSIFFGPDFQQYALRINAQALRSKLASLLAAPAVDALVFDPRIDMQSSKGRHFRKFFDAYVQMAEESATLAPPMIAEAEQMLMLVLLYAARHSYSDALEAPAAFASHAQLRRVVDYIEENWASPLRVEDLAALAGTSLRSLFRAFRQEMGCAPLIFIKQVRLKRARQMIESGQQGLTVGQLATLCGFSNASRFSKEYIRVFGETPFDGLRRRKASAAAR